MAKKDNKKANKYQSTMKEALEKFDLKAFKSWVRIYNPPLYSQFKLAPEEVQMATMCKSICNRTDMLNSEAHKKAINWLKEHNVKGRIF